MPTSRRSSRRSPGGRDGRARSRHRAARRRGGPADGRPRHESAVAHDHERDRRQDARRDEDEEPRDRLEPLVAPPLRTDRRVGPEGGRVVEARRRRFERVFPAVSHAQTSARRLASRSPLAHRRGSDENRAGARMAEETQPCPDCGTLVPFDPRFSPWCECGWNLEPPDRSHEWNAPSGPGRIYRALAAARATKLFEAAQRGSPERPRWGLEGTLLLGASSLLVCGMLLPPVGGVLLLLEARESPILLVPAIFLLAVAVAFAPRPGRLEKESLTSKESHPRLHDLVRRVAAELKVDPPELIAISADLNAYVTRVGLRQRRALVVGLPLLALLDREERVALLGHEMAHLANGDLTRGGIVHLAIHTLTVWIYLLEQ